MTMMKKKAFVCILVVYAVGVCAVVEKTREDEGHRRSVLLKNRTESKHHHSTNIPKAPPPSTESEHEGHGTSSASPSVPGHFHEGGPVRTPARTTNHSFWGRRPHRPQHLQRPQRPQRGYGGAIQLGPGVNFDISGNIGWDFGGDGLWWNGPHVCIRDETHVETDTDGKDTSSGGDSIWRVMHHRMMFSHTCDDTGTAYKCTTVRAFSGNSTTSIRIHECCPGYERKEDEPGCQKAVELTDLMSTLEGHNVTEMMKALRMSGLARLLNRENYTIFAPIDKAFDKYKAEETSSNVVKITPELVNLAKDMDDTIVGHVVKGFQRMTDVEDEELLPTELQSADIRINKYNIYTQKLMTANCVPILTKDIRATNGIVHIVQDLLPTVTRSLDLLVSQNPQLSQLSQVIKNLQLNDQGQYTLLAPTNAAFDKMKPSLKEKVRRGHRCGIEILKQHLLPNVICSAVTQNRALTRNVLNNYVTLSRRSDKLTVDGAEVIQSDVMGTNGVMHVIDQVLIPDDAGDILEALERTETSQFLELITAAGLTEKLQNMNNFTMFLPNNDAFKALPPTVLNALSKNANQLEHLIHYHLVPQNIKFQDLMNDVHLPTLDGKNEILVKNYYSFPFSRYSVKTVQCAPIVQSDVNSCGDTVHIVSKVLMPPSGDILHILKTNPEFTQLMMLIKNFDLEEMFKAQDPITFFAPTNEAFKSLSEAARNKLEKDPEKLTSILKSHMVADVLCCSGVFRNSFSFAAREVNLNGWIIAVEKGRNNGVAVNNVPVVSCDQTATNGVVHSVAQFIPEALRRYDVVRAVSPWQRFLKGFDFDIFGNSEDNE